MGMVMQEPILFNYSIVENILYGKREAYNSEIQKSTEIANALEFITLFEEDQSQQLDLEKASNLLAQLDKNQDRIIESIGSK